MFHDLEMIYHLRVHHIKS